jgi:NAD+ kinase
MLQYRRVGVTVKSDLDERDEIVKQVRTILYKEGAECFLDAKRCEDLSSATGTPTFHEGVGVDLLVVIGGDGTILRAVRELQDFSIPIIGVNRGGIGFFAEMDASEAPGLLPRLLRGEGVLDERNLLHISARRDSTEFFHGWVLNDAVISQGTIARLIKLRVRVNDEDLMTVRADGLIVATPSGSTAYSLAAGGPIVHPSLSAMILTPVNSHSFNQKPIVIPGNHEVEVEVLSEERRIRDVEVSLTLDGQRYVSLERLDCITARMNGQTVKFIRRRPETFFGTLRAKLHWGQNPDD